MKIYSIIIFVFALSTATIASAWESHYADPQYDENGDMRFGSEHVELTEEALGAADAFSFMGSPSGPAIEICSTVKDFNSASLGWEKLTEREYCPANFSELPDFFHSMEDYINQKRSCPPYAEWDPDECHSFSHFMGALNSSHFPPQVKANYMQYHRIAQAVLEHSNDLHTKLTLADALADYKDYWEECRLETLTYESIGQHYLEDQWAMGHMWYRWGGPEVDDFPLSGPLSVLNGVPRAKITYGTIIGGVSGMVHGWKSTVDGIKSPWDLSNISEDSLSFYTPGVEWVRPDLPGSYPGMGDLFLHQTGDFSVQRQELAACTKEGFTQLKGFQENPSELSALCWNNFATNEAMNIGLNLSPSAYVSLGVLGLGADALGIDSMGHEMYKLAMTFAYAAYMDPKDTYLAEGYTSKSRTKRLNLFSIKPNDEYNRIPSYMDPARNAPGDPADKTGVQPDNDLFGVRQVRYFNKCHADIYCEDPKIINNYRAGCRSDGNKDQEVDCQICEELAARYFIGDPPLCEILAPGVNPDPDNELPPENMDQVSAWCRPEDPSETCDFPIEGDWAGYVTVLQGTDKVKFMDQLAIDCGELTVDAGTFFGGECLLGDFNENTVCFAGASWGDTFFSGCVDNYIPSWTSDRFLNGPNDFMAEYKTFAYLGEFAVNNRLSVIFREQDVDGNTYVVGGSLGRCDANVAGSCWNGGEGVCTEYGSANTNQNLYCSAVLGGTYFPTPCPTSNVVGKCVRGESPSTATTIYYTSFPGADPAALCEGGAWVDAQ